MRSIITDKKGISPILIFAIIVLVMIGVYLILLLPIPSFSKIRAIVNYFLVIIFFFLFQGMVVFGYYKLGKLAVVGFGYYKKFIFRISDRTKRLFDLSK